MLRILIILLCATAPMHAEEISAAVTYKLKTGRFGDQLIAFSHAVWFSYIMDIPVYYKPFLYSDQLKLHKDPSLIREGQFFPMQTLELDTVEDYLQFFKLLNSDKPPKGILYEVPYYPDSTYLYDGRPQSQYTEVNWKDPEFLRRLRQLFAPVKEYPQLKVPKDRVPVALHYRSGVGYDKRGWQRIFPLKGPPDKYYSEALATLYNIIDKPLYVFIFTDDPKPMEVQQKFQSHFTRENIVFSCREEPNSYDINVLEDLFSFGAFDCLIRPDSNFSFIASLLFPFKIIVSPAHHRQEGMKVVIDQILFEFASKDKVKQPIRTILRKDN
ncbi:MAG: hypothetical protein LLG04_06180 [Parachlamydia sp.]|nr:hypothetical protein [Parachlamydia sp.]